MKSFILYISILALIIGCGLWSDWYMQRQADVLSRSLTELEKSIDVSGDTADAYRKLNDQWKKSRQILEYITDHKQLEQIQDSLASLKAFLDSKDSKNQAKQLLEQVSSQISGIPDHMRFKLGNLF